jgi:cytochrome c oxidase subunit 2
MAARRIRLLRQALTLSALAVGWAGAASAQLSGAQYFELCQSCHGTAGEGKAEIQAPAIAGLPVWYVERQVKKFQTGVRGAHPDDTAGLRMRPMSRWLRDEAAVKTVAEFVAALPPAKPEATVTGGDATRGQAAYALCTSCHGAKGEGMQALNGPPLANQSDWYLVSQIEKYRAGVRGANMQDAEGILMRPMSMTIADEQGIKDLVAYIHTLTGN